MNVGIDQRTAFPDKRWVYSTIEGTISHFELQMSNRGFEVPHEEVAAVIDSFTQSLGNFKASSSRFTFLAAFECRSLV